MRVIPFPVWAMPILVITLLTTKSNAAVGVCEGSPRIVGAFGAMDRPKPPVPVTAEIRSQLPEGRVVRRLQETKLSPSGEQIVMYDTKDDSEPNPKVAIVVHGILAETYEVSKLVEYGQGALYATSCEFEIEPAQRALAIAYTLSGDGTGSAFLVLTWSSAGHYELVFHRTVGQGRIVLGSRTLELWERTFGKNASRPDSSNFECEWCQHRYLITEFEWRNGQYVKTRSKRTPKAYDPAEISGTPLQIKTVE